MIKEYLTKIFNHLDAQQARLQNELKQLEAEQAEEDKQRRLLTEEIQRKSKEEALAKMQELQGLDRHIELRKRTLKILQRSLEDLQQIRSELNQLEFRDRITMAEVEAENLRQRREMINRDLLPDIEQRMQRLLDERKQLDSKLLNLHEEISLLRRRTQDVIEKGR